MQLTPQKCFLKKFVLFVCPATNLTFRLEHCGHLYCQPCIEGFIELSHFPIQCCLENCNKDVVLKDINKILHGDPERINKLLEKSMEAYLRKDAHNVAECPAPDCPMFFFKNELHENRVLCPLCQNEICVRCVCVYHDGKTCEEYQNTCFEGWRETVDLKQCPRCTFGIQKDGGSNHMTCEVCYAHFCWLCSAESAEAFNHGEEVYTHINQHHPNQLFDWGNDLM